MSKACERLIVVHNGKLINLRLPLNSICCTNISGFDVDKWKYAITRYYDEICKYDEIVLMNDSFFGPMQEFSDIFVEMEKQKIDFWGITDHKAIYDNEALVASRFVQRYFMTFRKNVTSSKSFHDFWEKLGTMQTYQDTEFLFEFIFTKKLCESGFHYSVYCNTADIEPDEKEYVTSHILFDTAWMLENRHLPLVPTYTFCIDKAVALNYGIGNNCAGVLQFVKENTLYDINMIWEYLLATQNVYDLLINLELTEVFPISTVAKKEVYQKAAVFVYLFYEDKFKENIQRLSRIPKYVDIFIITNSTSKKTMLEVLLRDHNINSVVLVHLKKGREWGALFLTAKRKLHKYDYFCFLHDKKSGYLAYKSVARDFEDLLWDNLIESPKYITDIINFFEENPKAGLIVPPVVNHGIYYRQSADYWTICYDGTRKLANRLGINTSKIEKEKPPIAIGSCFWCKTDALKKLLAFPFSENDFPNEPLEIDGTINHCLERIIPYVAQDNGYFTICAMNRKYFKSFNANNEYMIHQLNHKLVSKYRYCTFSELIDEMR